MKKKSIEGMGTEDLLRRIDELRKDLVKLNAQVSTGTNPKNPMEIRNIKKNIARMLTIIRQKEVTSKE